jgi:Ca2+-binding EF-hand superfamily protein
MNMIYNPTEADVKAWMQLTDANGDGKVTLDEFQAVVIKSLLHSGVQVYE